jgi:hypothetical protein
MTSEEASAALLDYANNYCNQSWTAETAPAGVNLFIEKAATFLTSAGAMSVTQKKLGDEQITYSTDYPSAIMALLRPYRKVRFV